MADQAQGNDGTKTPQEGATAAPAAAAQQGGTVTPPPATPKPEGQQVAPAAKQEPKRHRDEGDGEIPGDAEVIEMSKSALAKRLGRHTTAELKKLFGTVDTDKIASDLKELAKRREDDEKKRQAELSEIDREREAREAAEGRAKAAEAKARQVHEQAIFREEDRRMRGLAGEHFGKDFLGKALNSFARHLRGLMADKVFTSKQLDAMKPAEMKKIFDEFAAKRLEKHPTHAKDYEAKLREKVAKELKDEAKAKAGGSLAVTNGSKGERPAEADGGGGAKDMRPGRKNSMSSREARTEAAKDGVKWW